LDKVALKSAVQERKMSRDEFVVKEKQKLEADHVQITEELEHLRELMQAEVDVEPDEGDAEIFEREKNAALIAVLERKLGDIESALRSIEKGQYGTCERCGKQIELERLEVKPDATLCLSCQQEVERLTRRNRPTRQIEW
jgi:RNA polymerase-binding protein DksA